MQKLPNNPATASCAISSAQSYLFVPATRPDRYASALSSGADAVIIDLEDAVQPDSKVEARAELARWVSQDHPVIVRINARGTSWFDDDIAVCARAGVVGIVLPKTESAGDISAVVANIPHHIDIYPLVETARGMMMVLEIARVPKVRRVMFGTLDFINEMGMDDDREPLNYYRAQLALASRVAGIESPVDGVTPDVRDIERLAEDASNGKRQGFGAKLCIHPNQIQTVHDCYRPSEMELAWAARVVNEATRANCGAIVVDGKMVDRPVVLRAERLLALAAQR